MDELRLSQLSFTDLSDLENMEQRGPLEISNRNGLHDLSGAARLTRVEAITLSSNVNLTALTGLPLSAL